MTRPPNDLSVAEAEGNVQRTLGRIEGTLQSIREEQLRIRDTADALANSVTPVLPMIPVSLRRISELEATVAVHESWRQRGVGIVMVLGAAASILGAFIHAGIQWIFGRH